MRSKVYLVGAGPGRPDLITLRGLNILKEADTVIYDYLIDKTILEHAGQGAELICCGQLAKKGRYGDTRCQNAIGSVSASRRGFLIQQGKINNLIVRKVKEGKKVVRLKNGDPSLFSRCSQELEALVKEKIDFEVVPGVTAAGAASCLSGIPLTDRKVASSCVFVTGHEDPTKKTSSTDWNSLAKTGTIVLYMAVENLEDIVKKIVKSGKDKNTPVAIVQNASLLNQKILTGNLENIVAKAKVYKIRPPAIIIIGKVAESEKKFNWLRKGKKVLFTGLSKERFFTKGNYFHLPLIKIAPMEDYKDFDNHLRIINEFDWIVFASRYAVEHFFNRLRFIGLDSRILSNIKIAAIGSSTKSRLLDFGVFSDLVPKNESSQGLLKEFKRFNLKGEKIFLPRSDIADKGLAKGLERLGARVTSSFAYRNIPPADLPDLNLDSFDEIIFTSPSTVRNFKKRYGNVPKKIKIRCIGDVTAREAKRWRLI